MISADILSYMATHQWSITRLDSNTVALGGACDSSYGDEPLYEAAAALDKLGMPDSDIDALVKDLHARYGRNGELNIMVGVNEHVEAARGNYRLDITVDPAGLAI